MLRNAAISALCFIEKVVFNFSLFAVIPSSFKHGDGARTEKSKAKAHSSHTIVARGFS